LQFIWYLREGRNSVLEQALLQKEFGSPEAYTGALTVEQHQPGRYLRLSKSSGRARRLQFQYRWLTGVGPQANFDEVTFDASSNLVLLTKKQKQSTAPFSQFSALRMREVAGKGASLWHLELLPQNGRPLLFVTSEQGDRKMLFEQSAPLAKAVSAIVRIPVKIFVAGNVWTPGWPPKEEH
jgi:hypothetical protein